MVIFGCQKVEEIPLAQNEILPLALGNSWTYVDTVILTTTEPAVDTLISEITFRVTESVYADRHNVYDGSTEFERIHGWDVTYGEGQHERFGLFTIGNTIYTTGDRAYGFYSTNITGDNLYRCPIIGTQLIEVAAYEYYDSHIFAPVIQYPLEVGTKLNMLPVFQTPINCLPPLSNEGFPNLMLSRIFPLVNSGSPVLINTVAGAFDCIDYGGQYWAKGIGMVASSNLSTSEYNLTDGSFVEATVDWRRSLVSYNIE